MDDSRVLRAVLLSAALSCTTPLFAQPSDDTPRVARLVKSLGADDYAARRAADLELLRLGDDGRRQLEAAAKSEDPEVRLRALNLLERIAVVRLWEPTSITIEAAEQKVSTVFAACSQQTGNHIFVGNPYGDFTDAVVSVRFQDKPYWQALDALARQTGNRLRVHYDSRMSGVVVAKGVAGDFPTAYSGPVRAQIISARRAFSEELDYEDASSEVTHTFQLNLQLMWEDRFRLVAYGAQPEVVEARTDTGVHVSGPPAASEGWNVASPSTRQVTASLKLNPPPAAANKLSLLRLRWNMIALGEMTSILLDHPRAKSELHREGVSLAILAFERQLTGRIEMTVLVSRSTTIPGPPEILFQENTIELLDAEGRALKQQSQHHTLTERGVEFRLAFQGDSASEPAQLRFTYPRIRSRRNLEIIFRDVPLPLAKLN